MYHKILFAIDDDEALTAAEPVVAAYARRWAADVRVLHVHRTDAEAPNGANRQLVKAVIGRLANQGVHAEGEIRLVEHGDRAASVIATAAAQAEADLVAIGSHGRSDLAALFLGSVSHAVAAGLDVPVLVIRASSETRDQPRTILVAIDGSPGSDQAVLEAAGVASAFGAQVLVLHVEVLVAAAQGTALLEPQDEVQAEVDRALAALAAHGVRASGESLISQSVVSTIVLTAERVSADLVVLGSRRPSDIGGLLLGSTAHAVIHRLRCPVLLARRVPAAAHVS
jgi:nucleotide-binding universal stress UspA family protein